MALFTEDRLKNRVRNQILKSNIGSNYDSINYKATLLLEKTLEEQKIAIRSNKTYDIFLSHSSSDAQLVEGLKLELEDLGYSVYVDWIEDPELDRSKVTKNTALLIKKRMQSCKALIYAFSENSSNSKWMPWELGYFDGTNGKVAVLPISQNSKSDFKGSEYLGIYYYIQIGKAAGTNDFHLWIHETSNKYVMYKLWLTGNLPYEH